MQHKKNHKLAYKYFGVCRMKAKVVEVADHLELPKDHRFTQHFMCLSWKEVSTKTRDLNHGCREIGYQVRG